MCGIFGFVTNDQSRLDHDFLRGAVMELMRLSEPRGREAAGLAISHNAKISIYKQAMKPSKMLRSRRFTDFIDSFCAESLNTSSDVSPVPVAVIGHARLVTNGTQAVPENNQPISTKHIVGIHNGIITNDRYLLSDKLKIEESPDSFSGSDSTVLFSLIDKYCTEDNDIVKAISMCYKEIAGSASIALFTDGAPLLAIATNTGSLYYSNSKEEGFFVFGSERYIVEQFLKGERLPKNWRFQPVQRLHPLTCAVVRFEYCIPDIIDLNEATNTKYMIGSKLNNLYKIVDASMPTKDLRRCSRCILPETYPFISFDEQGVCNYCRKYKKQEFLGRDALESVLQKYRSKNGEPDCIVGFSGGRDSSYGLHVLKRELGMHPIAYTYDWAMVTDTARRNQAKVIGKLGVEHIIRAADIHTKRRYIRKNIFAWLKKPELGMVPLFMAGDKMFYYYGRQLRKETGIRFTIFAAGQQLEQMEFKVGFCGIDQDLVNNTKLYHFDFMVKLRLAMWYSKQYLLNPSYLNESLIDSIFAFYASFINKDDYLYLYYYIPWEEKLIEETLKEDYGWESDGKYGKNQWRMGDGHTAFIDYIYHTIAGFSEFDNFRSNQIREGLLTREKALELIKEDNKPRLEMLLEFGQLIGFNLEEVLLKINSIPKLF
jgi:asparagine synthetase B (glutamine-hydrolysing)